MKTNETLGNFQIEELEERLEMTAADMDSGDEFKTTVSVDSDKKVTASFTWSSGK